ncbi:MAG: carboxylating nicotinate-nucleotide diphosphorylase [Gemmatimonadetes bacterium]|nr:carboxylating nicotinate-nucleotide diphosphorylase [Gemmatimonadota bacterium]
MDTNFDPVSLEEIVTRALREDMGDGDVTTEWTLVPDTVACARFEARQSGVLSGLYPACLTFREADPGLEFRTRLTDGDRVEPGQPIAEVRGAARSLLTGERTALNFMRHLSGIATMTRQYVDAVRNTGARIVDTRKTTPGLRDLEKRAVVHGGGTNHRHGLFDMVLIKDNHIAAAGGIAAAVRRCRSNMEQSGRRYDIEVETSSLDQVEEAVRSGADWIMLDNMSDEEMRTAVGRIRALTAADRSIVIEASGAITLERIEEIAKTGVDVISVGALTHSAPALDISLNIVETA